MKLEHLIRQASILILVSIISFLLGIWATHKNKWPVPELLESYQWIKRYMETGTFSPKNRVFNPKGEMPAEAMRIVGTQNGFLGIMQWNQSKKQFGITLLNSKREPIHYWPLQYHQFDADGPSNGSIQPHGMHILKDGSVVVSYDDGDVLVRVDQCGNAIWIKNGIFHHQLGIGEKSFWIWQGENTNVSHFQKATEIDFSSGETINSIDLIEDVIVSHNAWEQFLIDKNYQFRSFSSTAELGPNSKNDIFHPNDVEPLTQSKAASFPMFKVGDLLISIRQPNLVAVLDKDTKAIKWFMNDPEIWWHQHDPDFNSNGTISVFNNFASKTESEIVIVNPVSKEAKSLIHDTRGKFFTKNMGTHQYLPDNSVLVVAPIEGRVLIFGKNGDIEFEYYNIVNHKSLGHVQNAQWMEDEYFVQTPSCSG